MPNYQYKEYKPAIHDSCFIAPNASIIGRVELEKDVNIWFGAVLRGDVNKISIGEGTNIQDLSMLHVVEEFPLIIGKHVTVGHSVVLHACEVGDGSLIGMQSCLLDGCKIGKNSLVAAGSLVPPGKEYPDNSLIMGNPARVLRSLKPEEIEQYSNHYKSYVGYKNEYLDSEQFFEVK